jgi:hypothetical protein
VEELPFDAQGPASIPGVGGVIKAQHSQPMFSILHTLMKKKYLKKIILLTALLMPQS